MACSNATVARYQIRIRREGERGDALAGELINSGFYILQSATRVSGISLGTQGEVALREYNRNIRIPDGVVTFQDVTLEFRIDHNIKGFAVYDYFVDWWDNHRKLLRTIIVDITGRDWVPFVSFEMQGSSIKSLVFNDHDLGNPAFFKMTAVITPYEVVPFTGGLVET